MRGSDATRALSTIISQGALSVEYIKLMNRHLSLNMLEIPDFGSSVSLEDKP